MTDQEIKAIRENKTPCAVDVEKLCAHIDVLERIVAESYQVIAVLAEDAGRHEDPQVIKAMDNAGFMELTHDDVLPFNSKVGV